MYPDPPEPGAGDHEFSAMLTQVAIRLLRHRRGEATVQKVLAAAGEQESAAALERQGTWLSYRRLRSVLEAVADELGGASMLGPGDDPAGEPNLAVGTTTDGFQALGSPGAMLAALESFLGERGSPLSRVMAAGNEEIAPTVWRIWTRLSGGYQPFPELCFVIVRLSAQIPALFGFRHVRVAEVSCQRRGDETCTVELHWEEGDALERQVAFHRGRCDVLEQHLASLHQVVAAIVSDQHLDGVLEQIVGSASVAVDVPGFVLALNRDLTTPRGVYSHGVDAGTAERLAKDLLAGAEWIGEHRLVTEVRSPHRSYGWLAAVEGPATLMAARQREMLESYARLAATVLDSAVALDTARREASTARALLGLARSLGEVTTTEQVATRLARAVPDVVDCDRALVVLNDPATTTGRVVAASGFDSDEAERLHEVGLSPALALYTGSDVTYETMGSSGGPWEQELTVVTGPQARVTVPIIAEGRQLGLIMAAVTDRAERLAPDDGLEERLLGLAAQAAVALHNSQLVDRISHQAMHDTLTGLPNRVLLEDRVQLGLQQARRDGSLFALLFVDLDRFKTVNDSLGHHVGDALIREVSVRVRQSVRAVDTVARTGGDEFVIALPGIAGSETAAEVAAKVLDGLKKPFRFGAYTLYVSASIGIAVYPDDGEDYGVLLQRADRAMYSAKKSGRSTYARNVDRAPIHKRAERIVREAELHEAVLGDGITVLYQPQVRVSDLQVMGAEALVRWNHPRLGQLGPGDFLPLAEECGLVPEVDRLARRLAFAQAERWQRALGSFRVAVNVSALSISQSGFVGEVGADLEEFRLDPSLIEIEITEDVFDDDVLGASVRDLCRLGVAIAIDDFGTAASNLRRLQRLPVHTLKTDRSLLPGGRSQRESAILAASIRLAHEIGVRVVAEGVEKARQVRQLRELDCDLAQGYLFGRPMPADDLDSILYPRPRRLATPAGAGTGDRRFDLGDQGRDAVVTM